MPNHERDAVDAITAEWTVSRPDLDVSPMGVIGRISRASRLIDRRLADNFARHGIESWMFDVMATLRRIGEPHELTAGQLMSRTMVTTGAMTNRIDRLAERGFVERIPSATDRRSVTVRLTGAGVRLVDQIADSHYATEREILAVLSPNQQQQMTRSLRSLLLELGDRDDQHDR